jgi:hypothetical protein
VRGSAAESLPTRRQVVPTPTSLSLSLPPSPGESACVCLAPERWRWDDAGVEEVVVGAEGSTLARRLATAFPAPMPCPEAAAALRSHRTMNLHRRSTTRSRAAVLEEAAELESASHHTLRRPLPLLPTYHQEGAELTAGTRERAGSRGRTRPSSQRR